MFDGLATGTILRGQPEADYHARTDHVSATALKAGLSKRHPAAVGAGRSGSRARQKPKMRDWCPSSRRTTTPSCDVSKLLDSTPMRRVYSTV